MWNERLFAIFFSFSFFLNIKLRFLPLLFLKFGCSIHYIFPVTETYHQVCSFFADHWKCELCLEKKNIYLSIYLSIYLYIYLSIDRKIDWFLGIIHFKPRIYLKQLSHSFHLVNLELKNLSGLEIIEILEKSVKISKINNCILVANLQSSIFVVLSNHFHDIFII